MNRSYFAVLGVAMLVGLGLLVASFGVGQLDGTVLVAVLAVLLAADLLVVGGITEQIPLDSRELRWYHMVGTGIVVFGLLLVGIAVERMLAPDPAIAGVVSGGLAGLVVVWIGVDFARGGVHHDLSRVD